jgi:hypothetical protein
VTIIMHLVKTLVKAKYLRTVDQLKMEINVPQLISDLNKIET